MSYHHIQIQRVPRKRLFQSQDHTEEAMIPARLEPIMPLSLLRQTEEAPRTIISGLNSCVALEVAVLPGFENKLSIKISFCFT